jgi:hypothetical protein
MKWNVVPPSIAIDGRDWWVRTKTGVWKGGLGPHAPIAGVAEMCVAALTLAGAEAVERDGEVMDAGK